MPIQKAVRQSTRRNWKTVFGINLFLVRFRKSLSRINNVLLLEERCVISYFTTRKKQSKRQKMLPWLGFIKGTFLFISFCWNEQWCEFRFMHGRWYISSADLSNANNTVNVFCRLCFNLRWFVITEKCSCYLRHSVFSPKEQSLGVNHMTSNCASHRRRNCCFIKITSTGNCSYC